MLLMGNGRMITRDPMNPFWEDGCVAMEGGRIVALGGTEAMKAQYPQAEFVDARRGVIMPGLINAHEHIYSAFARGMAIRGYNPKGFLDILDGLWWTLDRHLLLADTRLSADATMIDCIENGVTTLFDHHASYGQIEGSLFAIGESAKQYGVRANLCYEVSDRDGPEKMRAGVQENVDWLRFAHGDTTGMVAGLFGMHAQFTLSDATLRYCREQATEGAGFHIHVAEGIEDVYACLKEHGKRPVDRLFDFGILGPNTLCGHCTHVSDAEMDLLLETGSNVAHNPESNMGNAIGCPPTLAMLHKGICVGLGTDGYTNDMLESLKVAKLLHQHHLHDATVAWSEAPQMLFDNNAKLASRAFNRELGVLKPGAAADVIALDYTPLTPLTAENLGGHVLFGMSGKCVTHTVIDGKLKMRDRALLGVDKQAVLAHCRETADALWKRINA
ncbi:MAG TPA: putative aminohydrolase SsnA [Candidatus Limiplasma sp.]|nr:putative aminohydrolase SsnA [Candidatus Limiplasma sp.]HPS82414.1 putative aminohydrolase SsnA [Candidatus Limiplasma sp.]